MSFLSDDEKTRIGQAEEKAGAALQLTEFPNWKISADTFITLTPEIAMAAAVAMMQHYNACFAVEEAKKAELAALESAEDVAAWLEENLNTGWPDREITVVG